MKKNLNVKIYFIALSVYLLFTQNTFSQVNLQWPCGQYVTRQELVSGSTYKSVINVLYTTPSGGVGLDKVCENTSYLFNAAAFYNGYIWAWRQYPATTQSGSTTTLVRINNDCTVNTYPITFPTGFTSVAFNNAFVDPNGNFYMGRAGNAFPNIILYKIDLNNTSATATVINITPNGTAFTGTANFGDMYFDGTNVYIWQNNQGLGKIDLSNNTYTRIGSVNEVAGSLFINSVDPGYLYGYGSSAVAADNTTQNTIVKIKLSDGSYSDVAVGGASVSQSDGAGCPSATFQEPKPVANPDESLNNSKGSLVTVSPITNNDVVVGGTIVKSTVNMVAPTNATDVVTDAQGKIISMKVPNEGTWTVNPTTGDISFEPLASFTNNPTPIYYNVKDDKGNTSNDTTVTITYLAALPIDIVNFSANQVENSINLYWKTAYDKNFNYFEVYSGENLNEFTSRGKVDFNGSSVYSFTDFITNDEKIIYYKLKLVDMDGSYKYSNTISVKIKKDSEYVLTQNPVVEGLLKLNTNFKYKSLDLLNAMGQKYEVSPINLGNNSYAINVHSLPNGMYFLMIQSDQKIITKKVLIQN